MKLQGDQLGPQHVVFVNNRMVQSNIKELDTDEGWVDVFTPLIPNIVDVIDQDKLEVEQSKTDEEVAEEASSLEYEVRRLKGKVKVAVLKDD